MIRTAYPTPPVRQLRLHLELVTRRTRRALFDRCRTLRARPDGETVERESYAAYLKRRESYQKKRALYDTFEKQFDGLVGAVCFAAQEGVTPEAEDSFTLCRAWFLANYTSVSSHLGPHLVSDDSDVTPTHWGTRRCDTFEALFLPQSITALLEADNGCLIDRLMRAQQSVTGWYETLRHEEKECL